MGIGYRVLGLGMFVLLCSIVLFWAKLPEINTMLCYREYYVGIRKE